MSEIKQEEVLVLLQENMSSAHLFQIKPFLYSSNIAIAQNVFWLITELEINYEIQRLYLSLSYKSVSNLVRLESNARLPRSLRH